MPMSLPPFGFRALVLKSAPQKKLCLWLSGLTLVGNSLALQAQAEPLDLLRSIPLTVNGYASAQSFPERFSSPEQVVQALNSTPVLLVHMEALRRAYHELDPGSHDRLLEAIHKRRLTNEKDLMLGFDHGYAQLVFKQNKTGLFFLRKANDFFQDQFSALAYGMAEVEADLNLESATPETTTTRKLDAMFKLADAVQRDAKNHQPGFWPSYIQVIEKMKPMAAYKSFSNRDFSLVYVPYGNAVVPLGGVQNSSLPLTMDNPTASLTSANFGTVCSPEGDPDTATGPSVAQQSANFNGMPALIQFFGNSGLNDYVVRISGPDGRTLTSFKANTVPNRVVEDLDKDGVYEIVIRQYRENPSRPVIVYRYTPCGLELDQKIHNAFQ